MIWGSHRCRSNRCGPALAILLRQAADDRDRARFARPVSREVGEHVTLASCCVRDTPCTPGLGKGHDHTQKKGHRRSMRSGRSVVIAAPGIWGGRRAWRKEESCVGHGGWSATPCRFKRVWPWAKLEGG